MPVRLSALQDLSRHASGPARAAVAEAFEHTLLQDDSAAVRAASAVALADAKIEEAVDALVRAFDSDAHRRVRQMALMALGELSPAGHPGAETTIEQALNDDAPELRFQALIAYNRMAGDRALRALCEAVADRDAHVRHIALRLIEERWLDGERSQALPEAIAKAVSRALDDPAWSVRLVAAIILSRLGDERAAAVLCEALDVPKLSLDPEDEHCAIELCGDLRLEAARPGLERRAWGVWKKDRFQWQARVALAKLGDARARAAILRDLGAWSRDARTLAVAAAGRAGLREARGRIESMRDRPRSAEPEAVSEALRLLEG